MLYRLDHSKSPPRVVQVEPKDLGVDIHRRRVILFPGSGVDDSVYRTSPKSIVGSFKYVEQALASSIDLQQEPLEIYLYSYEDPYIQAEHNNLSGKGVHYRIGRENDPNYLPSKYGRNAMRDILRPLILEPNESFAALSPAVLKQRLGTLTVCTHSFGSVMSQHLADALIYELRKAGWDEPTISDTVKQLVSVSVANIARTDYPQPNFTQYFFMSTNDTAALSSIKRHSPEGGFHTMLRQCGYPRIAGIMEREHTEEATAHVLELLREEVVSRRKHGEMPRPMLRPATNGFTVHALLPDDEIRWMERSSEGHEVCRVLNKEESERIGTPVVHDFRTFLHGDHKMGEVLINVLNNAVQREPGKLSDGHTLLLNTIHTAAQHHFRISQHKRAKVSERGIVS